MWNLNFSAIINTDYFPFFFYFFCLSDFSDELEIFAPEGIEDELMPTGNVHEEDLDVTIPAVELTKEEKRRLKNRKKGWKRREKKNERLVANAMHLAEGTKTRMEIAEESYRRRVEGMVARERGRMRKEAEDEIERRLACWKADIEAGRVNIDRGISAEKRERRSQLQKEHLKRKRAERQTIKRRRISGWAALGRQSVCGDGPASYDSLFGNMLEEEEMQEENSGDE